MRLKELYRYVDLKKGEEKTVGLFIGYSFCMGVAVAIFYTATMSLFLVAFERTMLPKAYIAGGIAVYVLGNATSFIQKRIRFSWLIKGLTYFLMISVSILVLMHQFSDIRWFIFVLFLWNRVFVFVNGITFWATAAKIFNLQQGKRLYGLISTGEVVSSIVSYFSVPLLLKFISTEQLLYIVAVAVVGCILLMNRIVRSFSAQLSVVKEVPELKEERKPAGTQSWRAFLANPYYLLVFLLAMMPVVGLFFVDFMFAVESKNVFPDKELLASFLGVFFGFCALFEILIKTFLYNKIINRFGLTLAIALLPLTVLFSVTLAVVYGTAFGATALFFAFIVLSRFFMSSVRKSINEPAFQVLMQPIPASERADVQSRIEGGPKALGNIIPGVILLLLTSLSFIGTVQIAAFFLIILFVWVFVALKVQSRYRTVLRSVLESSKMQLRTHLDAYRQLAEQIVSEKKKPVLNYEKTSFDFILKLAHSSNEADRILAADLLGESGRYFAYQHVIGLINDKSCDVKNAALVAAGSIRNAELWPLLIANLESDRSHEAAAYGLLLAGEGVVNELGRTLNRPSGSTTLLIRVVRLLQHIGGARAVKYLRSIINHPESSVRDEVYEALKQLDYHVMLTERGFIGTEIEDRIALLVWIMATQRDLEKYPPWSPIQSALESEKKRIIPKIFTLFSLLPNQQRFDFIGEMLVSGDDATYGYLLEVMNMTLPDEWKNRLIPLFEDIPLAERLKRIAAYYPISQFPAEDRLKDIVNKHYSRVSEWLKVNALQELAQNEEANLLILAAHAISPSKIIAETAMHSLYRHNQGRYLEMHQIMEMQGDTFHLELCKKILSLETKHDLLIHKVGVLHQTALFGRIHEDELIPLASDLVRHHLEEGETVQPHVLASYENLCWIVAEGSIQVQRDHETTERLAEFDWGQVAASKASKTTLFAETAAEIYVLNSEKIARVRPGIFEIKRTMEVPISV